MKISELIKELEALKAEHGDIVVVAHDAGGRYEINKVRFLEYDVYNDDGVCTQSAISIF